MVREHAVHNGEIIKEEDATLKVTNREVQFGFSTYESIRIIKRHPVHLADHLKRLEKSCAGIFLVHPFTEEELTSWVYQLIETDELDTASIRILIVGGSQPQCFITATALLAYPDSYYLEGVSAYTYEGERLLPSCKTGNLLLNYMALEASRRQGGFEALLVNREGEILEGTRSNFFAFKDGRLYTAPSEKVLLGVTRERVIEAAQKQGIEVVFKAPLASDLQKGLYDELFISATSMAAMPLCAVNGNNLKGSFARTLAICKQVRDWELED
ncbi:aminotransferase class IV [uncultured Sphaerochaeta sp.]|uniref:aminotransferase class IV n=1 Tax=uncultured Sphaerochaeta sp. TaxID=886478 RepID=UPI002A0A4A58|nr:aminotransferase class IV [uncultured Sphaerochaeta sp.]